MKKTLFMLSLVLLVSCAKESRDSVIGTYDTNCTFYRYIEPYSTDTTITKRMGIKTIIHEAADKKLYISQPGFSGHLKEPIKITNNKLKFYQYIESLDYRGDFRSRLVMDFDLKTNELNMKYIGLIERFYNEHNTRIDTSYILVCKGQKE